MSDHLHLIVLASELYSTEQSSVFKLEEEYMVLAEPQYGHHKNIIENLFWSSADNKGMQLSGPETGHNGHLRTSRCFWKR